MTLRLMSSSSSSTASSIRATPPSSMKCFWNQTVSFTSRCLQAAVSMPRLVRSMLSVVARRSTRSSRARSWLVTSRDSVRPARISKSTSAVYRGLNMFSRNHATRPRNTPKMPVAMSRIMCRRMSRNGSMVRAPTIGIGGRGRGRAEAGRAGRLGDAVLMGGLSSSQFPVQFIDPGLCVGTRMQRLGLQEV